MAAQSLNAANPSAADNLVDIRRRLAQQGVRSREHDALPLPALQQAALGATVDGSIPMAKVHHGDVEDGRPPRHLASPADLGYDEFLAARGIRNKVSLWAPGFCPPPPPPPPTPHTI